MTPAQFDGILDIEKTCFHKIGHISTNYGPILKIQNLACSGLRARYDERDCDVAREIA